MHISFLAALSLSTSLVRLASSSNVSSGCHTSMDGKLPVTIPSDFTFSGNVRRYYIAAEEIEWDYAPTGWDNWLGVPFNVSARAQAANYTQYGTKWLKALYRGYTDATFTTLTTQPAFQGTQGPTIRAEVGDMIEILFFNRLKKNYATIHSMGLAYQKTSEGSDYPNNTMPGESVYLPTANAVPPMHGPGSCVVYKWLVKGQAGPNGDAPAKIHSYHSYVSLPEDANTGLIGPTIIYAAGKMASTMASYREFPLLYNIYMESLSWLSAENRAALAPGSASGSSSMIDTQGLPAGNETVWKPQLTNLAGSGQFPNAPAFYTMNGYVFANNPTFEMCEGDQVIWGVNAYGQASHAFHMHGNGFDYENFNQYAESVNDGVGKTLYMKATGVGLWQVICHVQNHLSSGMVSNYRVYPKGQCPLGKLAGA